MYKNPKTPYVKSFLGLIIDFMPIYDVFGAFKVIKTI